MRRGFTGLSAVAADRARTESLLRCVFLFRGKRGDLMVLWSDGDGLCLFASPVIVYDYTPTRSRAGPAEFLEGYRGYLQADAYSVYDAFFKSARGMTEVGCWTHYPDPNVIQSSASKRLSIRHSAGKVF